MSLVLVIPRKSITLPQGVSPYNGNTLTDLLADMTWYSHKKADLDPRFVQVLPYVVIQHQDTGKIFTYIRGRTYIEGRNGGESRLYDLLSIGVGGHLEQRDQAFGESATEILMHGLYREIQEELGYNPGHEVTFIGFLNDLSNEVGRVHLGIAARLYVDRFDFGGEFDALQDRQVLTLDELSHHRTRLEPWSQMVLKVLREEQQDTEEDLDNLPLFQKTQLLQSNIH